jgi:preprotein translocase subunit SecG
MPILVTLLYIVFALSAIVLIVVILLQEGRGGGFGQALGEHGQQTFGVGAKGINTFTGYTAMVFLVSAIGIHMLNRSMSSGSVLDLEGGASERSESLGFGPLESPPPGGTAPPGETDTNR